MNFSPQKASVATKSRKTRRREEFFSADKARDCADKRRQRVFTTDLPAGRQGKPGEDKEKRFLTTRSTNRMGTRRHKKKRGIFHHRENQEKARRKQGSNPSHGFAAASAASEMTRLEVGCLQPVISEATTTEGRSAGEEFFTTEKTRRKQGENQEKNFYNRENQEKTKRRNLCHPCGA